MKNYLFILLFAFFSIGCDKSKNETELCNLVNSNEVWEYIETDYLSSSPSSIKTFSLIKKVELQKIEPLNVLQIIDDVQVQNCKAEVAVFIEDRELAPIKMKYSVSLNPVNDLYTLQISYYSFMGD